MHFTKFHIKNFKGIEDMELDLSGPGKGIYTLIGLNESGKTTILEAMHELSKVFGGTRERVKKRLLTTSQKESEPPLSYRPKGPIGLFSDSILISASLRFEEGEQDQFLAHMQELDINVDAVTIPKELTYELRYVFKDSKLRDVSIIRGDDSIRGEQRVDEEGEEATDEEGEEATDEEGEEATDEEGKEATDEEGEEATDEEGEEATDEEGEEATDEENPKEVARSIHECLVQKHIPKIVYFPTFLVETPAEIHLDTPPRDKNTVINERYKTAMANLAESTHNEFDFHTNLVECIGKSEDREVLHANLQAMSQKLTEDILTGWQTIFGGQEVQKFQNNFRIRIHSSDRKVHRKLQLTIEHGTTTYRISERSLGFRWFFSFILFTKYGHDRNHKGPALYLFDEPASNLHAKAQEKLLENLPGLVESSRSNRIVYATHSPYLIEPKWLNQLFVINNQAMNYDNPSPNIINKNSIIAENYRSFIGNHSEKETHYQPILEKLQIKPSKLEKDSRQVMVEGISDFYILEYGRKRFLNKNEQGNFVILPSNGASAMAPNIYRALAYDLRFVILLDDDEEGNKAKRIYLEYLPEESVLTLANIDPNLENSEIEDIFTKDDQKALPPSKNGKPSKKLISLFFAEKLAAGDRQLEFSRRYQNFIKKFVRHMDKLLNPNP